MGDLIKKIKSNFLGKNSFSVGFNNRSPVEGISRKASPLNGYTPASASFDGSKGAISTYGALMNSNYGSPEVPDLANMGDVLSKAVGQFGYMAGTVANAVDSAIGSAKDAKKANTDAGLEKGDKGFQNQSFLNQSTGGTLSRRSSSPLNQVPGSIAYDPNNNSGLKPPDPDETIDPCKIDPNSVACTGKSYQRKATWDEMSAGARMQEMDWW